jgi:natural product biosynthesis luciferase-like monooxygenase protein
MSDPSTPGDIIFESELATDAPTYLGDYQRVQGIVVLPVTAILEMALAAAVEAFDESGPYALEEVEFRHPLFLSEGRARTIRVTLSAKKSRASASFSVSSPPLDGQPNAEWITYADGVVRFEAGTAAERSSGPLLGGGPTRKGDLEFSLFYFGSREAEYDEARYDLLLEGAKFADRRGFTAVWTPERHFHPFGGSYPAPAVLAAALATITKRVGLRAGSVVLPLHHPLRVAEEWSVIDNLSKGRVGVSFATGWASDDFALSPDTYADRKDETFRRLDLLRRFWRGETVQIRGGSGKITGVKLFPTPRQPELPAWLTIVKNPEMYARAGELGIKVLTNLLGQTAEELAGNIVVYRDSLARHGHDPETGHVTLLVHTFIGEELGSVRDKVRAPFCDYLRSTVGIIQNLIKSLDLKLDLDRLSEADIDALLSFAFDRYFQSASLLGTRATALEMLARLREIGVDEIGCFIDFGVDAASVMESLRRLDELRASVAEHGRRSAPKAAAANPLAEIEARCAEELSGEEHYERLRAQGLAFGPSFRVVRRIRRREGEALGLLQLPDTLEQEAEAYGLHPALLDGGLQVITTLLPPDDDGTPGEHTYLPTGLKRIRIYDRPGARAWCHARLHPGQNAGGDKLMGDVRLVDETGRVLAEVVGLRLLRLARAAQPPATDILRDILYELQWEPLPQTRVEQLSRRFPPERGGRWLIFADGSGVGSGLSELLAASGEGCVMVSPGTTYEAVAPGHYKINPSRPEELRRLIEDTTGPGQLRYRGVVHLWSLEAAPPEATTAGTIEAAQEFGSKSVLTLVQELAGIKGTDAPSLWLVTRGSQQARLAPTPVSVGQAPLWGLARVIQLEHPELRCASIDLAGEGVEGEARLLFDEVWYERGEDQVAFRGDSRYAPRLARRAPWSPSPAISAPSLFRPDGSYLITGGLGELGLLVAEWMVRRGAKHLVLIGRRGATGEAEQVVARLREAGAEVVVVGADIAAEAEVAEVLERIGRSMPPLRGVIHTAMVLDDGVLLQMDRRRFDAALKPKVYGAWNLHRLTLDDPLDFFVLFSSAVSLHGSAGQGNYVAANAFLDSLAHHRRSLNLPALTVDWGRWGEVRQQPQQRLRERMALLGMRPLDPEQGLQALEWLLRHDATQAVVMSVNWPQVFESLPASANSHVLSRLVREVADPRRADAAGATPGDRATALALSPDERRIWLESHIKTSVGQVLRLDASELDVDRPLNMMGLDSLMAIEIKNRVETSLGLNLPLVSLLEGPSVAQLAARLSNELSEPPPQADEERLAHLLNMVGQLSDDEARELLDREKFTDAR